MNIEYPFYERANMKFENRALWIAWELHDACPMRIFVTQVFEECCMITFNVDKNRQK